MIYTYIDEKFNCVELRPLSRAASLYRLKACSRDGHVRELYALHLYI